MGADPIISLKGLNLKQCIELLKNGVDSNSHAHFLDGDLTGADLSHFEIAPCIRFKNCLFNGATFANNTAYHLTFEECNFDSALFYNGKWATAAFMRCSLKQSCFFRNHKEAYMRFDFYDSDTSTILTNLPRTQKGNELGLESLR